MFIVPYALHTIKDARNASIVCKTKIIKEVTEDPDMDTDLDVGDASSRFWKPVAEN